MLKQLKLKKGLFILVLIIAIIVSLGILLGFYYSSLPEHHPQTNKQACESVGGQWSNSQKSCLLANKKAGEECTDGAQCTSGVCSPPPLSEKQKKALINGGLLKNIVGNCHQDILQEGCIQQVIMGTVSRESMCLGD